MEKNILLGCMTKIDSVARVGFLLKARQSNRESIAPVSELRIYKKTLKFKQEKKNKKKIKAPPLKRVKTLQLSFEFKFPI